MPCEAVVNQQFASAKERVRRNLKKACREGTTMTFDTWNPDWFPLPGQQNLQHILGGL
jgi:hypothetical protein